MHEHVIDFMHADVEYEARYSVTYEGSIALGPCWTTVDETETAWSPELTQAAVDAITEWFIFLEEHRQERRLDRN